MRGLRLVLLFVVLLLAPVATFAATDPLPTNRAEIESLIGTLENDAERARLIAQLKLLIQSQQPPATAESPVG